MGGVTSKTQCTHPLNPDVLSVLTLSDSAVQRLPLEVDDTPLDKEFRNQNIDDFWRDRLECLDNNYSEMKRLTEKDFQNLERKIKKMSTTTTGKVGCRRVLEDSKTCYLTYPERTLYCSNVIKNLQLCVDTVSQEASKKRFEIIKKREEMGQKTC